MPSHNTTGLVDRIYISTPGCFIRLRDTGATPQDTPMDGYYLITLDHLNYQCLVSLAMLAADSNRRLSIRTNSDITPSEHATVSYFVLDFPA